MKWFPFYPGDYLRDTGHLTAAEHGAYLLLLIHYMANGGLPADERIIQRITKLSAPNWARSRSTLRGLFSDDTWRHERCDAELTKAIEISRVRSASAKQKHSNCSANAHTTTTTTTKTKIKKERKRQPAAEPPEFLDFWNSVPKPIGRHEAVVAYNKAIQDGADPLRINAAAKRWAIAEEKTEEKYIARPSTWLNKHRYEDYHPPPERETNLEYDPETKNWRWKRGYEPQSTEGTS